MRILITGAAGFLGSHLCDRFIADGHEVEVDVAALRDGVHPEVGVGIDEARVDGEPLEVPDARASRGGGAGTSSSRAMR